MNTLDRIIVNGVEMDVEAGADMPEPYASERVRRERESRRESTVPPENPPFKFELEDIGTSDQANYGKALYADEKTGKVAFRAPITALKIEVDTNGDSPATETSYEEIAEALEKGRELLLSVNGAAVKVLQIVSGESSIELQAACVDDDDALLNIWTVEASSDAVQINLKSYTLTVAE